MLIEKLYNREKWLTIVDEPIFRNIDMKRGSNKEDVLSISIAPYPKTTFGIQIRFNYHIEPSDFTALKLVNILKEPWEKDVQESNLLADKIVGG